MERGRWTRRVARRAADGAAVGCGVGLCAAVLLAFAGCGESAMSSGAATGTAGAASVSAGGGAGGASAGGEAVATVAGTPVTKGALAHWMSVTAALSHSKLSAADASSTFRGEVLGFLITERWVFDEAARLGVTVSGAEAHRRLDGVTAKQFPKPGALQRYLASSGGETVSDLLERAKLELLEAKVSRRELDGKSGAAGDALLNRYRSSFERRWRARTTCRQGYVMEDCSEYKGPLRSTSSSGQASTSTSTSSSSSSSSSSSTRDTSASGGSSSGAMSLGSTAFGVDGSIPSAYTCAGADTAPPLQWQHLPAHTVEMVLFVIDDSSEGREGGIRWVVAGLNPGTSEIKDGKLPAGAIVGLNSSGQATYGGICPAGGHSDRIEFVLWALDKHIALDSGFVPAVAEQRYSKSELASAVTYATASRP